MKKIEITLDKLGIKGKYNIRDMWSQEDIGESDIGVVATISPHGAVLYKLRSMKLDQL